MSRIAVVPAAFRAKGERRLVRVLRRMWEVPALNVGEVAGLPVAAAVEAVMLGRAEPVSWEPTDAELREAALAVVQRLEADRERVHYDAQAYLRLPGVRRQYLAAARVLGVEMEVR
jgi:hypothetical protein